MKIVVSQIGAREHYAVPRALHQHGMLAALVTDWYGFGYESRNGESRKQKLFQRFSVSAFQHFAGRIRAALAAHADGLPDDLVHAFPVRSLFWKWRVRRLTAQGRSHEAYLHTDAAFAAAVARLNLPPHDAFFGYSYASLEMLVAEKKRGILTILDQIDPGAAEFELVAEEMARFPQLAGPPPMFPAAYYDRNRREWELADRIVVNSEWSRKALMKQGVPSHKLVVVPLAFEQNAENLKAETLKSETLKHRNTTTPKHRNTEAPLRVLFLAQVNVRKGIHYLMEAARMLEPERIRFDIVGRIGILPAAVASAPKNMTFHGPVSPREAPEWYCKADLFVLPTLSDGFAITQLEAMAHGLPVIATPCCGQIVSDGVDGFVVPPRDAGALAGTIRRYFTEPDLLSAQWEAALAKSRQFTLETLGENLRKLVEQKREEGREERRNATIETADDV